jgi:cytochrome c1
MNTQPKPLPVKWIASITVFIFVALVIVFGVLPGFFEIQLFENELMSEEKTALNIAGIEVPKNLKRGEFLYTQYCESCHGSLGAGNGPTSRALRGKVPNFRNAVALKNGVENSEQVKKTLNEGIVGSEMPQFKYLSSENLEDISNFVVFLSKSSPKLN